LKQQSVTIQNLKSSIRFPLAMVFSIAFAVVGMIGARALTSLMQIVLARRMDVTTFGTFTATYALLSPLAMAAGLGLDTWLLRQGGNPRGLTQAIGQVLVVRLLSLVVLVGLVGAGLALAGWPPLAWPIVLAALGLGCEFFVMTGVAALRAQMRNQSATLIQVIVAGLGLWLVWQFWRGDVPLLAATGYRLLAAVSGVVALLVLLRVSLQRQAWVPHHLRAIIRQSRAFFAADLLANVVMRADLVLVSLLIGAVGAGIYSPALTIINASFLVPNAVWYVVVPLAARQRNDRRALVRLLRWLLAASVLFGISCALLFTFGAEPLITLLFGAQYRSAVPLLQIMAFIPLLKSFNFCWVLTMVVYDAQSLRARLLAGSTIFNVVANLLVIPAIGVAGAAWVNFLTEVVLMLCYSYGTWRTLYQSGYE
jgi:O-antigen/teichoic acid export membrane protein